jgi:hypothetical protein
MCPWACRPTVVEAVGGPGDSVTQGPTDRITGGRCPEQEACSEGPWLADGLWPATGI